MELRQIWEIILNRKWIIIQAFLVIFFFALGISYLMAPVYEGSAKIFIKGSETASSLLSGIGLRDFSPLMGQEETDVEGHMELIKVKPILEKIIYKLQLRNNEGSLMKPDRLLKSGLIMSKIRPRPYVELEQLQGVNIIEIKANSTDPDEASMIANTLADVYITENLKDRRQEYKSAREFIEGQIKNIKADYLDILEEIRRFKIAEATVDLERETQKAVDKMADLMSEKEQTIIDLAEVRAKLTTLKAQAQGQDEQTVSSVAIDENPHIENLKKQLTDLELALAAQLIDKTRQHPDVMALTEKIKKTRSELRAEVMVFKKLSRESQDFEREITALEAHLLSVNKDIETHRSYLYAIPQKAFIESQLGSKYAVNQELYSSLLEYINQISIAEAMTLSDIRLVESAPVPDIDKPTSPNILLNAVMGIVLGLMFGFGLAFLVDYVDDTIKTPDEAKAQGMTLLGTIPKFKRGDPVLISERDPRDPVCEAYRTVRNSIRYATLDKPVKTIIVTSAIASEGKTTTVINLAVSMTHEGKTVLIMDTDLRKPRIHETFGLSNSVGITSVLTGQVTVAQAVKKTNIDGLLVLCSGPVPPDPARLVESEKMRQLIQELSDQYDTVILDSPPVLVANDAIVLAGCVDAPLAVIESGRETRQALSQEKDVMEHANIQSLGAVLNKFSLGMGRYYYYYNYKNGYYADKKK